MDSSDLDEVVAIDATSRLTPWSRQSFLEELRNPFSYCFTVKRKSGVHDQTRGFICFRILDEESELLALAIHPQCRREGLGKKLMKFYFDFCSRRKVKTYYLEAGVSNLPASSLYQSFAYQPVGIRSKFYEGREDALLMVRRALTGSDRGGSASELVFDDPGRDKKQ